MEVICIHSMYLLPKFAESFTMLVRTNRMGSWSEVPWNGGASNACKSRQLHISDAGAVSFNRTPNPDLSISQRITSLGFIPISLATMTLNSFTVMDWLIWKVCREPALEHRPALLRKMTDTWMVWMSCLGMGRERQVNGSKLAEQYSHSGQWSWEQKLPWNISAMVLAGWVVGCCCCRGRVDDWSANPLHWATGGTYIYKECISDILCTGLL